MSDFQSESEVRFVESGADPETRPPKQRRYTASYRLRLIELADACNASGDVAALFRLRALLERNGELEARFVDVYTDSYALEHRSVSKLMYGTKDLLGQEMHLRIMNAASADLAGPNATPIERLAADRVIVCREYVAYFENRYARDSQTLPVEHSDHLQKLVDRAHKRLLSAIKSLALVQRLRIPAVQINIGENQINCAKGAID